VDEDVDEKLCVPLGVSCSHRSYASIIGLVVVVAVVVMVEAVMVAVVLVAAVTLGMVNSVIASIIMRLLHVLIYPALPPSFLLQSTVSCAKQAAGALVRLVQEVVEGRLSNGMALIRPPGHHAEAHHARGFCILNNVAVAASYARRKLVGIRGNGEGGRIS